MHAMQWAVCGAAGIAAGLLGFIHPHPTAAREQTAASRRLACQRMVEESIVAAGVRDARVIEAIVATPRHEFLPTHLRRKAYEDRALPIGGRQTISSPFIVALMTEALEPKPGDRVLEVGTGSGYQAAVLSGLVKEVYSVEIVELLGKRAKATLKRLKYENVFTRIGDGYQGWSERAPFDKIILTCSPERIPSPLVDQLQEGGLLVAPVGDSYQQTLCRYRKRRGRLECEPLRPTLFVPMTGRAGEFRRTEPNSASTKLVNGGFEDEPSDQGFLPGWYYQRQLAWKSDEGSPEGVHHVAFHNELPGRAARALQGFRVDGRRIGRLTVSCWVKGRKRPNVAETGPLYPLHVAFFSEERRDVGGASIGPAPDHSDWRRLAMQIPVPQIAREAVLGVGLMGARGDMSFDDLRIDASPRRSAR